MDSPHPGNGLIRLDPALIIVCCRQPFAVLIWRDPGERTTSTVVTEINWLRLALP
jgi:hypothetical protein